MAIRTQLKQPVVETMTVSQARQQFSETLNRVYKGEARVIIEKSGIPVAGIVPMGDVRAAEEKEEHRRGLLEALENVRAGFSDVSEDEAEREIAKALADVKRERRLARRIVAAVARVQPDLFEATDDQLEASIASILKEEEARTVIAANHGQDHGS